MANENKLIDLQGLKVVYDDIQNTLNGLVKRDTVQDIKTVNPSTASQTVTADEGKSLLAKVTVNPINSTLLNTLDGDFKAANIKKDVEIFGVTGTFTETSKGASAADIISGKEAFVNGGKVTGTMPIAEIYAHGEGEAELGISFTNGKIKADITDGFFEIPGYDRVIKQGYLDEDDSTIDLDIVVSGSTEIDPKSLDNNLVAENIKYGSSIFGVSGSYSKIPTSNASEYATKSNILAGKKFFIEGGEDTGTMANYSSNPDTELTPSNSSITLSAGYYNGKKISVKEDDLSISNSDIGVNGSLSVPAEGSYFTQVNVNLTESSATLEGNSFTFGSTVSPTASEQTITINKGWIGETKTIKVGKVAPEARLVYTVTGSFTPSQFTGSDKTYSIQNSNIKTDSEVIIMPASSSDAANWGKNGIAVINEMINGSAKLSAISNVDTTAINYKMIIINPMN